MPLTLWTKGFLAAAILSVALPASAATYQFQTLNNAGDPNFNQLLGINNAGTIVGYFGDGNTVPNNGYVLNPPSSYTAENFPGAFQTQVVGINNTGQNVGFYVNAAGDNFGFVHNGSVFTSVAVPGSTFDQLLGVNNLGIAAGFDLDAIGTSHGFTYNIAGGTFTPVTLPSSFGAMNVTVTGVNNAGIITGFYEDAAGNTHGFIDDHGAFTQVDGPFVQDTMLLGLNNNGEAVGSYLDPLGVTRGFIYNIASGTSQTVDDPFSSIFPAFDVTGTTINGVNDQGDLVGFFSDGTNVNGFLAAPVATVTPEPSSLLLMGTGLMGVSGLLRVRRRA